MPTRSLLRPVFVAALALAAFAPVQPRVAAAAPRDVQVGVVTTGHDARVDAVLAGIHAGFRLAGMEPDLLEKNAAGDRSVALATVKEFAFEGIDVVFALGADAAQLARDSLREPSVVFAAVGYPEAIGVPGRSNVCGVAGGVPAAEIVACVRRVAPAARTIAVVSGGGVEDEHIVALVARRAVGDGLETVQIAPADGNAAAWAEAVLRDDALDAVWLAPGVPEGHAEALATALEGSRTALIGSCGGHLVAGCSVVLRTDPAAQGLHAAALARRVLEGEAPESLGVRHLRRRRLEVNLDAARRLGHELPLPVLATADYLIPAFERRR